MGDDGKKAEAPKAAMEPHTHDWCHLCGEWRAKPGAVGEQKAAAAEQLLGPDDIDHLLKLSPGTASRKRKRFPHIVLPDGSIRFRLSEVLAACTHKTAEPQ